MSSGRYVVVPSLLCEAKSRGYLLLHDRLGIRLLVNRSTALALDPFMEPRELPPPGATDKATARALARLVSAKALVPESQAESWDEGPLTQTPNQDALGHPQTLLDITRASRRAKPRFAIVGAPSEHGSHHASGAQFGPALIRSSFPRLGPAWHVSRGAQVLDLDRRCLYSLGNGLGTVDLGDIRSVPGESLADFGARLHFVATTLAQRGIPPITLGGDHAISLFPIRALLKQHPRLGILHFDAHHDHYLHPGAAGPHSHASVMALAMREPGIEALFQVGLRTLELVPAGHAAQIDRRISFVTAREAARRTPEQILSGLPRDLPWYLSFDVDCLAPELAPETGTQELGGLGYYQALDLIQYAARQLRIVGADFVEVARRDTRDNLAAKVVARYLLELTLAGLPEQRATTYLHG